MPNFQIVTGCKNDLGADLAVWLTLEKTLVGPTGSDVDINRWSVRWDGVKVPLQYVRKYIVGAGIRIRFTKPSGDPPATLTVTYKGHDKDIRNVDTSMLGPFTNFDVNHVC